MYGVAQATRLQDAPLNYEEINMKTKLITLALLATFALGFAGISSAMPLQGGTPMVGCWIGSPGFYPGCL